MKKIYIAFLLLIIFGNSILLAQTQPKNNIKQCDAQMARQLVEEQAMESKSTTEADKRINILIRVADYLWKKDNDSARKYFSEAFKLAQERFKEKGISNTSKVKFLVVKEPDYRFEVIEAIGKFDTKWAEKLTDEVLKDFDKDETKDKRDSFSTDEEINQTLQLGVYLLDVNENAAISVFRKAMNYPALFNWYYTIYQIADKKPTIADQIYSELLVKYSQSSIKEMLYLSAFPFGNARILGLEKYRFGYTNPPYTNQNLNLQKQFILTLLNRINNLTPENNPVSDFQDIPDVGYASSALKDLMPIISQKFPELMQDFSRASLNANRLLDAETQQQIENNKDPNKNQGNTFEEKIEALEEADSKGTLTDYDIVRLILEVKDSQNLKMLESLLGKIKETKVREKSENFFYFTSSKIAIKEKNFTEARKFADKVPQIEYRAVLYFDMADAKLKEPLTKFESLEILTEVYRTAEKSPDSVEKAQVLLGVAFMFDKIDRSNSIESLSKAITTANKLENPDLFQSFIMQQIVGEKFGVFASYNVPGFNINQTFDQISKQDFQSAISQAQGFSDRYLRTLAILASVKNCEKIEPNKIKEK